MELEARRWHTRPQRIEFRLTVLLRVRPCDARDIALPIDQIDEACITERGNQTWCELLEERGRLQESRENKPRLGEEVKTRFALAEQIRRAFVFVVYSLSLNCHRTPVAHYIGRISNPLSKYLGEKLCRPLGLCRIN